MRSQLRFPQPAARRRRKAAERLCCRLVGIPPAQALPAALTDGTAHVTGEQLAALLKGCGEALASDAAHIGQRLSVWRGELGTLPPDASQDLQRCMDTLHALLEQAPSSTEWVDVAMTLGLALPSVPRTIRIELRAATSCSGPWLLLVQAVVTASDPADVNFIEATAHSLCNDAPAWVRDQMALPGAAPLAEKAVSVLSGSGNAPLPSQQQELPPVPVTPSTSVAFQARYVYRGSHTTIWRLGSAHRTATQPVKERSPFCTRPRKPSSQWHQNTTHRI
jgi:hypothetical protein